jgi:hypothetical protein
VVMATYLKIYIRTRILEAKRFLWIKRFILFLLGPSCYFIFHNCWALMAARGGIQSNPY